MTPDWPKALWLLRHGESAGNVARDAAHKKGLERIAIEAQRDMDVPLSPLGEKQAAAVGRWLHAQPAKLRPTAVLTSPYLRARGTAEIVVQRSKLSDVPLVVDERLREREFGVLDRLTRRGIEKLFPDQAALRKALGKFYHRPHGGESWCDVILRLRTVLDTLCRELPGERVLLVCHSVVVLCFRYLLERMTEEQILAIDAEVDVANCSITSYELEDGRLVLRRFNFVAPLLEEGAAVTTEPDAPLKPR
jgi:2,3-bisphosphoglycerate-dependent phosphoglycerate mutase